MLGLLARTLPYDPACFTMVSPQFSVDAGFGIQRCPDDIGHLGIALWMTGLAGKRNTDLPELRR